jgi:tripartite-type tricarboxylate transporter receptor subunit TctC
LLHLLAATMLATAVGNATPARAEIKSLELLAPSSPGSGYDQLARTMQAVLQEEKLASGIQVVNVAGGGGTVGLAQYVTGLEAATTTARSCGNGRGCQGCPQASTSFWCKMSKQPVREILLLKAA